MKADHLCFTLHKFGKYKTTNRSFRNHFPFCLELWMYHTPLTWYEQENLGYKAHVEVFAQSTAVFASLHIVSWITKTLHVGPTGRYTRSKTHNSALLSSLSNNVCGHKGNVLFLRNVTWYCLTVASLCNLLNQTYILTANLKVSTKPTYQIQVTHVKSPKFTSVPKF
jgi:hypothetical protein